MSIQCVHCNVTQEMLNKNSVPKQRNNSTQASKMYINRRANTRQIRQRIFSSNDSLSCFRFHLNPFSRSIPHTPPFIRRAHSAIVFATPFQFLRYSTHINVHMCSTIHSVHRSSDTCVSAFYSIYFLYLFGLIRNVIFAVGDDNGIGSKSKVRAAHTSV